MTPGLGDRRCQLCMLTGHGKKRLMACLRNFSTTSGVRDFLTMAFLGGIERHNAQHTRRTMHLKDVLGDRACRMNIVTWRQTWTRLLKHCCGMGHSWKRCAEKVAASDRSLCNSGSSFRISVYKLGFLVEKGYWYSGLLQFIYYLLRIIMENHGQIGWSSTSNISTFLKMRITEEGFDGSANQHKGGGG